ncbi:MAG: efflux RND transporter permease subunit [Rikenellaceae bacterium]|nr:efflux RND transporter permease subunit [Rikenellaceae bacterium]
MNLPKYSLENKKVIYFFLAVMLIGGIISFFKLAKKEDSPFAIKTAVLITQYPGATPQEVEELVTEPIEREIQSMSEVYQIKSESRYGMSKITIELEPTISPKRMPVKWDELRRKVANIQPQLPQGASAITVNDDFGDVYGIYYALAIDDGFSYKELRDWAQKIKVDLTPIDGVQKVQLFGEQYEVINVFLSSPKLANLGIDPNTITQILGTQNLLVNTGEVRAGNYQMKVMADGTYKSIDDIANQLIITKDGSEVRLGDIADIKRGYMDPPSTLMRVDGKRAIGIGVATGAEDDVVAVGDVVAEHLDKLKPQIPVGMDLVTIYPENTIAREANNGFILNLIESLVIVIAIIFLVMGARAGFLIGSSLLFSVGGTLLIMLLLGVGLNRTSLAAFIIAMGMLVDNAIVVTDNAQIAIKRGIPRYKALIDGATGPQWGLLGATFIAICSFLPLYLAPASVAEIVKPLFIVLAVSLGLSWVLALTQTPAFGTFILKENAAGPTKDPYDTKFYHKFSRLLTGLIRHRYLTLFSVIGVLIISLIVMGLMPQSFFPSMNKPYMRADLIFPEGFGIRDVEQNVLRIEDHLKQDERIKSFSITMGGSPIRYYLASASYGPMPNYANVLIETTGPELSAAVEEDFYNYMLANYPNILTRSSLFMLSPVPDAKIEVGFIGDNIDTLAALTQRAKEVALRCDLVMEVRDSWGNQVPVLSPLYSQEKGLRLGITRQQVANSLRAATNGIPLGEYREGDRFMPILLKDADIDSISADDLKTLPVFSTKGMPVKIEQVTDDFNLDYTYNVIKRYNRERCMLMQCEPKRGANAIAAFKQVYNAVKEEVEVPEGYQLTYFGDQEQQDTSNNALAENIPLTFLIIYVTLLFLFPQRYRRPVVIMAMLPLIFIGVVWGLLLLGKSLDFFAILGLLGLIGMNIKNAIVLVDQIRANINTGMEPLNAVVDATKTRIVPVTMASGTTILGMIPLLFDAMFGGMAATIMGGLLMATVLTIFVLPVTYCIFFQIRSDK